MHIDNSASSETFQTTSTSSDAKKLLVEPTQAANCYVSVDIATNPTLNASPNPSNLPIKKAIHIIDEEINKIEKLENVESEFAQSLIESMTHKKHDDQEDPNPLLCESPEKNIKFKMPTLRRWMIHMRLQWRILFYVTIGIVVLLILYAAMGRDSSSSTRIEEFRKTGTGQVTARIEEDKSVSGGRPAPAYRVRIDVYMESQCPDTADFLETQLTPTWTELKDFMDLQIYPFGKARWTKVGPDDYSFQCQHGQNECLVNQLMCCGIEKLKQTEFYLPYILCLQGTQFGDEDEVKCSRQAKVDHGQMQSCANSKHGRQLHYRMGNLTKSLRPSLFFVPWILVEGKRESGALMDLKLVICKRLTAAGIKPAICDSPAVTTLPNSH